MLLALTDFQDFQVSKILGSPDQVRFLYSIPRKKLKLLWFISFSLKLSCLGLYKIHWSSNVKLQ